MDPTNLKIIRKTGDETAKRRGVWALLFIYLSFLVSLVHSHCRSSYSITHSLERSQKTNTHTPTFSLSQAN
jgi:hypothetical protein